MTFREILQKEMSKQQAEPAPEVEHSPEFHLDPQVIFPEGFVAPTFHSKHAGYAVSPSKTGSQKVAKTKEQRPEVVILLSELDVREQAALELLLRYSSEIALENCLSRTKLNRIYRKLAQKYHPDRGAEGAPAVFHSICEAKNILFSRLKKAASPAATESSKAA